MKISLNDSHELCGRIMGALFVASQTISTHALNWNESDNRSLAAEARALVIIFYIYN